MSAPLLDNRVRGVISASGTGDLFVCLDGETTNPVGFLDPVAEFGTLQDLGYANYFYYTLAARSGGLWEVGVGYFGEAAGSVFLIRERILSSSNGGAATNFAGGAIDLFCSPPAELLRNCQDGNRNHLGNSAFRFFQRQAPTTATARTDGAYGPDRWYVLTQTAAINCERVAGVGSQYAVKLTQNQATAQRFGIAQVLETANCRHLRGQPVVFQGVVTPSTTKAIHYAIFEWTGTANSPTKDIVNTWTSTTYTAGNFFLGSNVTIAAQGSVTASFTEATPFWVSGTVSNSCNNLGVLVWTGSTGAQSFTLELERCGLYLGSQPRNWMAEPVMADLANCQRYFEKSYDVDQVPGGSAITSGSIMHSVGMTSWANNSYLSGTYYKVPKLKVATVTFYSYNGTADRISTIGGTDVSGAVTGHNHLSGYAAYNNSGSAIATTGGGFFWHHTAEAEL